MPEEISFILESLKKMGLLSPMKVKFLQDMPGLNFKDLGLESPKKEEIKEVGSWLAISLAEKGAVEPLVSDFEGELYSYLNKEKLAGQFQLTQLPADFYHRMRMYFALKSSQETERAKIYATDLITLRVNKITLLAVQGVNQEKVRSLLTQEELFFFTRVKALIDAWRSGVMEDGLHTV